MQSYQSKFSLLLTLLFVLNFFNLKAQTADAFTPIDEMPYFGECEEEITNCFKHNLDAYAKEHLIYPENHPEGIAKIRTYMKFVVEIDGSVKDVAIAKSSGYEAFDEAAIQFVQQFPTFVPAKQNGKSVSVEYILPVDFFFEEETFPIEEENPYATTDEGEVFTVVEKMPLFGSCTDQEKDQGFDTFYKEVYACSQANIEAFISEEAEKIRSSYPEGYYLTKVQFIIEKDGSLSNPFVKESSGNSAIDQAALAIVGQMQNWRGGTQRGIPVRVQYVLPIQFK